ncbi:MAG: hypothetical protein V7603_2554 [Micromonosporaceae bacterium]
MTLVPARTRRMVCATAVLALALAGCTSGGTAAPGGQAASRSAAAGDALALRGVCPDPVVIQSNWWPQAEDGAFFQLLGTNPTVDKDRKRVSGALVSRGVDTGVHVEIRSGGPANSFTPAARVLYLDRSVTLGRADIDQVAELRHGNQPVRAVFAPLDKSPLVLMWDPVAYPDFHTVADIGRTNTRVLYFQGAAYMDYLVGSGKLHQSQVEASYDGTPARFVAERGRIVQQGFLTNEVYQYQNELTQWKKKVAWTLVNDAGYPNYPEAVTIRADRTAELSACLHKLVPILQRATVDYAHDPARTNDLIIALVKDFGAFPYSQERARYAVTAMLDNGLLSNGGNTTIGDFDATRVNQIIEAVRPIAARAGASLPGGLSAKDLVTNDFLDPSIRLP